MMNLNNEYEKLLHYLELHKPKTNRKVVRPVVKPKETTRSKRETVEEKTKKLIEGSQIHSYVPPSEHQRQQILSRDSEGFNVQKFETMMRTRLIDEHKKLQSYERPYISVTELCSCLRQAYYTRKRYSVNLNRKYQFSYLYLINKVGNTIHDVLQELYDFTETEKTIVSEKYKVKGRTDGIRESFLYEIKSIDVDKFKNRYVKEHYEQALVYAYILNTEYDYNIKTITIIYVIRNLKHIIPFDIPIDNSIAESLLSRALLLKSSLDKIEVPDPIGATKEQCRYCLYKAYCEKDLCNKVFQPFLIKEKPKKVSRPEEKKSAFLL
jgi:hypothetical protein